MVESALPFSSWESYYVIIGSSAAALTGLNFVVIALGAETRGVKPTPGLVDAYETPTIVHFCAVLLVSALLSAPWHALGPVRLGFGATGIAGILYSLVILRRVTAQEGYRPELEDWIWRGSLPFLAYVAILVAAIELERHTDTALFLVAGSTLLLLYVGIHNAWDTVTYMLYKRHADSPDRVG